MRPAVLLALALTAVLMLTAPAQAFELTSPDLPAQGTIAPEFTCDGRDISPQLSWTGAPPGTKSFALTLIDPDAPGGRFVHWLVYDIPATATGLPRGGPVPPGAKEAANDFGRPGYGGPCPPSGQHRYVLTLYALDVPQLGGVDRAGLVATLKGHALATAQIVSRYGPR